VYVRRC
jgi:hypothetical protein